MTKKTTASKTSKEAAKKTVARKPAEEKPAAKKPAAKKPAATPASKTAAPKGSAPAKKVAGKPTPAVVGKGPEKKAAKKPEVKPAPAANIPAAKAPVTKAAPVKAASGSKPAAKKPAAAPKPAAAEKPAAASYPKFRKTTEKKNGHSKSSFVYKPEPSILDKPEEKSGPVKRYSDVELQEFKTIIVKKLETARKELTYLQGLITRKDEAGTEDTENKYMSMEDGSGTLEREQLNQMASRQIQFIDHLEKALMRIENKTYGICRVTGKLIDKARLRAVPHATLSMEAKQQMNK